MLFLTFYLALYLVHLTYILSLVGVAGRFKVPLIKVQIGYFGPTLNLGGLKVLPGVLPLMAYVEFPGSEHGSALHGLPRAKQVAMHLKQRTRTKVAT